MHLHILGIAGTFMGGIAPLAKSLGHRVTGADQNIYPPMSTQLEALGIELIEGWHVAQLDPAPDLVVIGNVMSRGNPLLEEVLNRGLPYVSGPQWLAEHVLAGRRVLAVAGTHGKTTTTSILAFLLDRAGLEPGFLIGGIAGDFGVSARLGRAPFFVVEADEYDTAFFDKRAKFVHYRPRTLILNNLEYDHADIYPDMASIRRQFHHLVRTVPGAGALIVNGGAEELKTTLAMGAWTPVTEFGDRPEFHWSVRPAVPDWSGFDVLEAGTPVASVRWSLLGRHNAENALAAMLAARHAGVPVSQSAALLGAFAGVKRRLEVRGTARGVTVYDDFAHHPTAIALTLAGLRAKVGSARILAVLEPRSNSMKLGAHQAALAGSLAAADRVYLYAPPNLGWDLAAVVAEIGARAATDVSIDALASRIASEARPGDHVLVMSNGAFGGLHALLLERLGAT